jgi:hypothetical protein
VEPRLEHRRQPAPHARRTATPRVARAPRTSLPARSRPHADHRATRPNSPPAPGGKSPPLRDRGISLLAIFTAATLLIVALVCVVAGIDRWWILIPVMAVDLTVTGAVLAVMVRLLNDGSST